MQTGTKISGIAHVVVLGWAVFGGAFRADQLPFEVREVSVITAEEYAALTASRKPPDVAEPPDAPALPDPAGAAPDVPEPPDSEPAQVQPDPAEQPETEPEPEAVPDQPPPETETTDTAPVLQSPEPEVAVLPESAVPRPEPRPADRVAPQPVAPPPEDAAPDDVEREQVAPDQAADTEREAQEATAPEEAADRIVTEAEETSELAPARSPRPPARRPRPPAQTAAASNPEPKPADTGRAVNDALAEAMRGSAPEAPVASGPPLTAGEKDALRVAVSNCWNVGSLSTAALATTVVVGVTMAKDGKPQSGTIRLLSSAGGSDAAARQAFEAARRAIIRCGARGYDLPAEKFGQWRDIEMTFNPERMRIK